MGEMADSNPTVKALNCARPQPPNSHGEALSLNVSVRRWGLWEVIKVKHRARVGPALTGLVPYRKAPQDSLPWCWAAPRDLLPPHRGL